MRSQQNSTGQLRGRHRRGQRRRTWVAAVLGGLAVAGGTVGTLALRTGGPAPISSAPRCARSLSISAAPEIAPTIAQVARRARLGGCGGVRVTAADPAAVADLLRDNRPGSRPDVWIPDSSLWLSRAHQPAGRATIAASLAKSPVVLAVPAALARAGGPAGSFEAVLHSAASPRPVLLVSNNASRSASALAVLASYYSRFGSDTAERGNLAALLRQAPPSAARPGVLNRDPRSLEGSPLAVPATEQAVSAADRAAGHTVYTAVYPPRPGYSLDYPFVVLDAHAVPRPAARLLVALKDAHGKAALEAAGFRSPSGSAGPGLAGQPGVTAGTPAAAGPPSPSLLAATLRGLALVTKPFQLLAVIDVSGSMATEVPGEHGDTRMDIARAAAAEGLGLLPDGSSVGLWRFSADLTPAADYQPLVPLRPLNPATRGDLAGAIQQLEPVTDGGTGLYDTVLAAVDEVRRHYDPTRVNSVVVLTDGKDEADPNHRIGLSTLLAHLRAEAHSARPVRVVTIAYGPDSDAATLRTISRVSDGTSFRSSNPRDLPKIFLEAVGARLCRTAC